MKRITRIAVVALGLTLCFAAHAQQYARDNVRFLSRVRLSDFPGDPGSGSGCAGYVSPSGKEYAVMGLRNGNAVVNITNPIMPVIVGHIPGANSQWHEVCVLGDYAYATTEGGGGIQIIDLRQVDQGIVTLAATYTGNGVSSGHTIQAIPESKLIMIHGGNMGGGERGLRALDCSDPENPVEVGTWTTKYVHDALYVKRTYGPDAGKMICYAFCANGLNGGMYIIDVTTTVNAQGHNVPKMEQLGFIRYYPNSGDAGKFYSHSGSMSPDGKYIFANDELDELNDTAADCTTFVLDVQDLRNPTMSSKFVNPINAIDHNSMTQDGFLFLSAYKSGLRIYDMANSPSLSESGFFDTYPEGSGFQFSGAWGTWAGFPSGNVIISDINRGLFVVDPSEAKGLGAPITGVAFQGFNGPANPATVLRKQDDVVTPMGLGSDLSRQSIQVTLTTDSANKAKVDVTLAAKVRNTLTGDLNVYAKNQSTGAFELIGSPTVNGTMQAFTFPNLDGTKYVSSANVIVIKVENKRGISDGSRANPPTADVDMIRAKVHN